MSPVRLEAKPTTCRRPLPPTPLKYSATLRIRAWSSLPRLVSPLLKRTTASNWLLPGTALPLAKAGWPGAAPAGPGWDWARLGGRVVAEDCARPWATVSAVPIGRASCRASACQYLSPPVAAPPLNHPPPPHPPPPPPPPPPP